MSCSPECDQDLSDLLDGVSLDEVYTRGRMTPCDVTKYCAYRYSARQKRWGQNAGAWVRGLEYLAWRKGPVRLRQLARHREKHHPDVPGTLSFGRV